MAVYLRTESGEEDITELVLNHALRWWKEQLVREDIRLLPYDTLDLTVHLKMRDAFSIDLPGGQQGLRRGRVPG